MSEEAPLLDELPLRPNGWSRRFGMHMKIQGGGAACYSIHDAEGRKTVIAYQYDTTKARGKYKPMETGFYVHGAEGVYRTWDALRSAWPDIVRKLRGLPPLEVSPQGPDPSWPFPKAAP